MFKKGVITDEISQDMKTAIELALRYKLDGIEIRSVWEKGPHELDEGDIREIRSMAEDAGLKVCCIAAPFFKCDIDNRAEIAEHHEILKKCVHLAQSLGTSLIRGFTFWNKGSFEDHLDRIVSEFEVPVKILEKEKMTMVLEEEPSVFAANTAKNKRVIEKINSPYIQALWDPANELYDRNEGIRPYPEAYNTIKPYIKHVHIKDVKEKNGEMAEMPIGEGQVDYRGQFRELLKENYNGFVVLETHYRKQHLLGKDLLALPKGSSFSYMGYESTEECLKNWARIMDEIS